MNPYQTPDSNHQSNDLTIHTALAMKAKHHKYQEYPSEITLGSPIHILNWLCDTGGLLIT